MKKTIVNILKVLVSGALSLIILSGFCLVFNYSGCHVTNQDGSTDYKWESNQLYSNTKEGFSWIHFDKNGFNNENDTSFDAQPVDILLMGSSHMEAAQMKQNESTAGQLNKLLPEYRTYNIGISGHTIYTCIQNMEAASDQYNPRKYVILETSSVQLKNESMEQVLEGTFPENPSHDSGIVYNIQKTVPAVKSLYKSVTNWMAVSQIFSSKPDAAAEVVSDKENPKENSKEDTAYQETLEQFLQKAAASVPENCQLIIFYHPLTAIDENGAFKINDSDSKELFQQACEKNGIIFVDETNDFLKLYNTKHILAHGFSNTAVGVGHLNQYGHQVIAASLANIIKEREGA